MRTKVINGMTCGYHDQMNRNDPGDPTGLSLLAMCLMQQAGITFPVNLENETEELEAFEFNGLGIYIRWMGEDYFLKTTALADEDDLFSKVNQIFGEQTAPPEMIIKNPAANASPSSIPTGIYCTVNADK